MPSNLDRLQRELEDVVAGVTVNSNARSPSGSWSPAQILEHLFLTYQGTNRGLAKCLEQGAPLATSATLRHRIGTLLVVNLGYLPNGRKAPERAVPQGMPLEQVRSTIFTEIQKMESGFEDCERRFGAATKIMDHPILGPLTASEWRKFHLVHGRHHARQIRERNQR